MRQGVSTTVDTPFLCVFSKASGLFRSLNAEKALVVRFFWASRRLWHAKHAV